MDAAQIADLLTQGIRGPAGSEDAGFHTGLILSWDEASQVNSVLVNNTAMTNLRTVQSGIGVLYQAGDTVMIVRKQTQYFILGKVSAPGGNNANQIKSAVVNTRQTTTSGSFVDLGTVGPSVTASIGTSRRALVLANTGVDIAVPGNFYGGGWFTLAVTGASTIVPSGLSTQFFAGGYMTYSPDFIGTYSQTWLVTASNGLNVGSNTFRLMYATATAGQAVAFSGRSITVIPF